MPEHKNGQPIVANYVAIVTEVHAGNSSDGYDEATKVSTYRTGVISIFEATVLFANDLARTFRSAKEREKLMSQWLTEMADSKNVRASAAGRPSVKDDYRMTLSVPGTKFSYEYYYEVAE